jgi:STE24 endopeptidase
VRYRDVPHGLLYLAVVAPVGMLGAALLARRIAPRAAERPGPEALPALALAILVMSAGITAISNQLSRRIEARADTYALQLTRAPQPFIDFEQRITVRNIAEPEPPGWAKALFGTHPTTLERIGAAEAFRAAARAARPIPAGS